MIYLSVCVFCEDIPSSDNNLRTIFCK